MYNFDLNIFFQKTCNFVLNKRLRKKDTLEDFIGALLKIDYFLIETESLL